METTIAAAHLVLSGTVERHPGLTVLLAHGGGAIVTLRGRLRHGQEAIADAGATLREPADASIGGFCSTPITHDPAVLRTLVEAVGADRVLLGSDYPFDMADPRSGRDGARRGARRRGRARRCCAGNAERVLGPGIAGRVKRHARRPRRRPRSTTGLRGLSPTASTSTTSCAPPRRSRAGTSGSTPGPRPPRFTTRWRSQAREQGHRRSAGEAFLRAAVSYHFAKFVWVLDPERNRRATRSGGARAVRRARTARPDGRADRGRARRRRRGREPAAALRRRPGAAGGPDPRTRLDQGGVLPLGDGVPAPRDGDAVARRPRSGRNGFQDERSAPTTRSRSRRSWTRSPGHDGLDLGADRRGRASASAATTSSAPPRSSRGSRRWPASAGRTTWRRTGTRCPR